MKNIIISALVASSLLYSEAAFGADPPHRYVGIQGDVGFVDGVGAGIVVSPYFKWLKTTLSYTNNIISSGGRAGITLDPLDKFISPTFTTEFGFTDKFNGSDIFKTKLPDTNYRYLNFQPGFDFGKQNGFRFFLRGGFTHLWGGAFNFNEFINSPNVKGSNPTIRLWVFPTFKVGFSMLFW